MVCKSCEKKLSKAAAVDPFRNRNAQGTVVASGSAAASSAAGPSRRTGPAAVSSASRPAGPPGLGQNKLLASKSRFSPLGNKCKICKSAVQQERGTYCQNCAYKRGVCSICGKVIMDTKMHKMSSA